MHGLCKNHRSHHLVVVVMARAKTHCFSPIKHIFKKSILFTLIDLTFCKVRHSLSFEYELLIGMNI